MNDGDKRFLFDDPRNVRRVVRALLYFCVFLVGLEVVVHRHLYHEWESLFGFYAIYGFVACVLLVLLAAELRKLIMRDEDYFERHDDATNARKDGDQDV